MEKIWSKIDPSILLHIIHRGADFPSVREDIVPSDQHLQMASLNLEKGKTFKPHKHISKDVGSVFPQESWVVLKGRIKCVFYDIDDNIVAEPILEAGDCSITLYGGHTYLALEPSLVREFKVGPYKGILNDKVFL